MREMRDTRLLSPARLGKGDATDICLLSRCFMQVMKELSRLQLPTGKSCSISVVEDGDLLPKELKKAGLRLSSCTLYACLLTDYYKS